MFFWLLFVQPKVREESKEDIENGYKFEEKSTLNLSALSERALGV